MPTSLFENPTHTQDIRYLNFHVSWRDIPEAQVVALLARLQQYGNETAKSRYATCGFVSWQRKTRQLPFERMTEWFHSLKEKDVLTAFTFDGFCLSPSMKFAKDVTKALHSKDWCPWAAMEQKKQDLQGVMIHSAAEAKQAIIGILNTPMDSAGIPTQGDFLLEVEVWNITEDRKQYDVMLEISVSGCGIDFDLAGQIQEYRKLLDEMQAVSLCKNAGISYDSVRNVYQEYFLSPPHYMLDEVIDFLAHYDWGMLISQAMFESLGGEARAKQLLGNPIVCQEHGMVWIQLNKAIDEVTLQDARQLKTFYNDALYPAVGECFPEDIRKLGDLLVLDEDEIKISVFQDVQEQLQETGEIPLNACTVRLAHRAQLAETDEFDRFGIGEVLLT